MSLETRTFSLQYSLLSSITSHLVSTSSISSWNHSGMVYAGRLKRRLKNAGGSEAMVSRSRKGSRQVLCSSSSSSQDYPSNVISTIFHFFESKFGASERYLSRFHRPLLHLKTIMLPKCSSCDIGNCWPCSAPL
jgi:hypothetical protein